MFIYNFKVNMKVVIIACVCIAIISAIFIQISANTSSIETSTKENYDYILTDDNFSNTLKSIHDNIDKNINKKVKISGFVFRMPDFKEDFFVCGRNMKLENEDKIVGFLCQSNSAKDFKDDTWVEVTGTIVKGFYQDNMPVIKVEKINKIDTPKNTYVNAPK